jgi:rubrerythrin
MDVFEFAMKMEEDGKNFYQEIAGKTKNEGVKSILTMLAQDEVKHYNTLKRVKEESVEQVEDTSVLKDAKNVFETLTYKAEDFTDPDSQIDLYKKAQELEKKSIDFYAEKVEEVSKDTQKDILSRFADEERKHYFLLEHMIAMLSRPEQWLEDAEWTHLEEY